MGRRTKANLRTGKSGSIDVQSPEATAPAQSAAAAPPAQKENPFAQAPSHNQDPAATAPVREPKPSVPKALLAERENPLGIADTRRLILKFAIPSVVAGLVSALYNIVDQIFIGHSIGYLGNAATNVSFPLTTLCAALALLLGVGCTANFSLSLGAGETDRSARFAATGIALMAGSGVLLSLFCRIFLHPLLLLFGATDQVLSLAQTYTGITLLGFPFLIFSIGGSNLIRADGSPTYAMACTLTGAVLNTILDPILIFALDMGIAGAAIATVFSQMVSCFLVIRYFLRFKSIRLKREHFRLASKNVGAVLALGMSPCFNQCAMMLVQIAMNNTLTHYGADSVYGSEIPLACAGVISKINVIYMAFVIGIAQGTQPILGYNYGAKKYRRVRQALLQALMAATAVSILAFLCFQLLPRQIISLFGAGDQLYFQFAERYFHIYMALIFLNGIQPMASFLFTAIGKARLGIFMSLTRQILFLLPLILLFPVIWGIDGVMYAGPIADGAAASLAVFLLRRELELLNRPPAAPLTESRPPAAP